MAVSDASPRVAVVTGASSGIGLYTALGLARGGMRVIMTGRNPERTETARSFVAARAEGAQLETALGCRSMGNGPLRAAWLWLKQTT